MELFVDVYAVMFVIYLIIQQHKKLKIRRAIEKETCSLNGELLDLLRTLNAWYFRNKKTDLVKSKYKIISNRISLAVSSTDLITKKETISAIKLYAPEIFE